MHANLLTYLYRNYITYDSLYALTKRGFYAYPYADNINIFIDMHSLISDIFGDKLEFTYSSTNEIASSIINLCAHLRAYYASRHKVWTKIYIVWSWNRPEYVRNLLPEYNAHSILAEDAKTILKQLVEENLKLLEILCPYIPDIYFVNGYNHETGVVIYTLISHPNQSCPIVGPNMIYSRDPYEYIDIASIPETVMFRPKKYHGQDKSYPVMKSNLIESYVTNELRLKWNSGIPVEYNNFAWVLSSVGMKARGVNGPMAFKKAIDPKTYQHVFTPKEEETISALSLAFDLDACNKFLEQSNEYSQLYRGIVNLYNPDEVRKINDLYFQTCPLDLNNL
jgi:hypothetical protein